MQETLLTIFPLIVLYAALIDMFTMTITNRTTLLLTISFFPLAIFIGLGFEDIAWHLAAGLLTLAIGIALFSFGFIGGGGCKAFCRYLIMAELERTLFLRYFVGDFWRRTDHSHHHHAAPSGP